MLLNIVLLLIGFVVLIIGADKLVDSASSLAARIGIPNIVIGLTVVAFGTSAPELVVNVFAALEGSPEMVLGNVIGSNLFNVMAILGICAVIYPLTVKSNTTWIEIPLSFLAALAVYIMAADVFLDGGTVNFLSRSDALTLLMFFCIFLVYNLMVSKNNKNLNEEEEEYETEKYSVGKGILFLILGLAGLVLGGKLIVDNAVSIAEVIGLSERVIGLTIVSIGTSLPELATSIVAVRKKNVDIAIGNVVGSNIFNIFLVLGVSATITPIEINPNSFPDIILNILVGILLFLFIFVGKKGRLDRWQGFIFLGGYIAYIVYLLA